MERLKVCSCGSEPTCVAGAKRSGTRPSVGGDGEKASWIQPMGESSTARQEGSLVKGLHSYLGCQANPSFPAFKYFTARSKQISSKITWFFKYLCAFTVQEWNLTAMNKWRLSWDSLSVIFQETWGKTYFLLPERKQNPQSSLQFVKSKPHPSKTELKVS